MRKLLFLGVIIFIAKTSFCQSNSEPNIKETLGWIRNKCLSYSGERYLKYVGEFSIGKPEDINFSESECSMTFVYPSDNGRPYRYTIYFSALDGNTITWSQDYANIYLNISAKRGSIASFGRWPVGGDYIDQSGSPVKLPTLNVPFNKGTFEGESNMKDRMTKAIKRAIILCGGEISEEKF